MSDPSPEIKRPSLIWKLYPLYLVVIVVLAFSIGFYAKHTTDASRMGIVAVGFVAVLILAILGLVLLLQISQPLHDIQIGARRFADGDFSTKLSVSNTSEIGTLAESLNRMASQLDEKIRTISQQNLQQQAVMASMIEGVLAVDTNERVISINRAAAELLGVNMIESKSRSIQEVIRHTQLQRFIVQTLASTEAMEEDISLTQGPEPRFLQASGTPLRTPAGGKIGALVVLNDVTRMRRLENVRREFVANVSHELKTPVTAIKGFIETLLDAAQEEPQKVPHFINIISRQADRLQQIIEDLLMLSRIEQDNETSQIKLTLAPLHQILVSAMDDCQTKAQETQILMRLDCPEGLMVRVNPPLIEQAVVNLLDNAIKYSERGETVTVRVDVDDQEVAIRVVDHGVGIAEEHMPYLFQRFYRVDKGRSRKLGGTGLGLAIVKHIAQAHHGRASAQSTPGSGSTFSIHLGMG